MKLKTMPIDQIKEALYNPRVDLKPGDAAYERLSRSIAEFDLVEPLVWNQRTGNLIGGHQRIKILKARGDVKVQVVVVDEPPEREKALNIALNNSAVAGDWDHGKLAALLGELQGTDGFDETLTGFDAGQIAAMLSVPGLGGEIDERIADGVSLCVCSECGHEHHKMEK